MIINIGTLSRLLSSSEMARKTFKSAVSIILHALEAAKLIDWRKLDQVSLDWEKGQLNLGDNFVEMLVGRSINEYIQIKKRQKFGDRGSQPPGSIGEMRRS